MADTPDITVLNETHDAVHLAVYLRPEGLEPVAWDVILTLAAMAGDPHQLPDAYQLAAAEVEETGRGWSGASAAEPPGGRYRVEARPGAGLELRRQPGSAGDDAVEVTNGLESSPVEASVVRGGRSLTAKRRLEPAESFTFSGLDRWTVAVVDGDLERGDAVSDEVRLSDEVEFEPGHHVAVTGSKEEGYHLYVK